ncbi:hypothetical protein YPPY12_3033, partial [Yersinia pestis PY-12]
MAAIIAPPLPSL